MKKIKEQRFLSFTLAIVMMFGLLAGVPVSANDVPTLDEWIANTYGSEISTFSAEMPIAGADGFIEPVSDMPEAKYSGFTGGKFIAPPIQPIEDKTGWIEINDRAGLEDIKNNLGGKYYLSADIDLAGEEWVPIRAISGNAFTGIFDGQGYVIRNLTIGTTTTPKEIQYAGLFGYVKDATIKNVGLEGSYTNIAYTLGSSYAGGICGYGYGSTTISNCYNTGGVSASSSSGYSSYAGGIYGANLSSGSVTIRNCYNTGDVSATSSAEYTRAGGICGYGSVTIINCYNTGDISVSSSSSDTYAGGICGSGGSISNCYNTGAVSAASSYYASAGGICGSGDSIINCYNTGDISTSSTSSNSTRAGGICASSSTIINCYNTGAVSASSYSSYAGGICGSGGSISNCYNTGAVSASTSSYSSAGGICSSGGSIINCYNTGAVSSAYAGGIFGRSISSSNTIINCYNTGDISSSTAGGICGYSYSSNGSSTISNCYNTGAISVSTLSSYAGGICGFGFVSINNCYNTGAVYASDSGGIFGFSYGSNGSSTISNCYNTGAVSARAYAGGIYGNNSGAGSVIISNCYWNSESEQTVNGSPVAEKKGVGSGTDTTTPLTTAQMKQQASFVGFDFADVWAIAPAINNGYPILRSLGGGSSSVAPAITTTALPIGTTGIAYNQTLTATGTTPITWSISEGGLPSGLTLSTSGTISGTPLTSETALFTVKATNSAGSSTKSLDISINVVPLTPSITTSTLPNGTTGTSYNQTLTATGTTPITWSIASGSLPSGLTLSTSGTISGTPTTAGTFTFTVKAANNAGSSTKQLSIVINSAWNIYNIGEETYRFKNYGDIDSPGGHCFGMSITSSAYYLKLLNIAITGGNYNDGLYALGSNSIVNAPICYYQPIQGSYSLKSTVAGGSHYKSGIFNIVSDWTEVVNYVKGHDYDNKGMLQIGFRKVSGHVIYGHAINFLRYSEVEGQPRIYAYDNNSPDIETYFYQDAQGLIRQAPYSTFNGPIDSIALRDVSKYFSIVGGFDATHVIYADSDTIFVEGVSGYLMDGDVELGERLMYEIPADSDTITIVPLIDNAAFEYLGNTYSFGEVNDDTVGIFKLSTLGEGSIPSVPVLTITQNPVQPIAGDLNGNGKANIEDAQIFLEYLVGNYELNEVQKATIRLAVEDYDNNDSAIKKLRKFLDFVMKE